MGAWSGEPFGNDSASDWAFELAEADDWAYVHDTLSAAIDAGDDIDSDLAAEAIGAAEVVARGIGRPTQEDAYTEDVARFVQRAPAPAPDLVALAVRALSTATCADTELAEVWAEDDASEWESANAALSNALRD